MVFKVGWPLIKKLCTVLPLTDKVNLFLQFGQYWCLKKTGQFQHAGKGFRKKEKEVISKVRWSFVRGLH